MKELIESVGKLSEPITVFLKMIESGCGTLYEPTKIVRKAKAEAAARIVETTAEIQTSELLSNAQKRLAIQEARRQANIESIVAKSVDEIPSDIPERAIDPDWVARFFQEAKDTSSEDIQRIWAKVLAGEYKSPGRFSKRALSMVKDLSKDEAEEIQRAASRVWKVVLPDGRRVSFLNIAIVDRWVLASEVEEENAFFVEYRKESEMLQDCGFLHFEDFKFHFSGEGYLDAKRYRLGKSSAKSLEFYGHKIVALENQPGFLRDQGPTVTLDGRPRINTWGRVIEFDAWRLTREGEALLEIIEPNPDLDQFGLIVETLKERGFSFDEILTKV